MSRPLCIAAVLVWSCARAADLPPDDGKEVPVSARRDVEVRVKSLPQAPGAVLPEGYAITTAAAAPLVMHPIMGCLDERGRLFVGDGVGVNWNKAQLEANPPNRVLLLEDTDKDGAYDKSVVFADKMTFPQGACWLNGNLYVCSPPGLWRLRDTDFDGVADEREMIVSGFEYTGNAADVHGPFLAPNGRLYWCHGRKGHKVVGKEGKVVHEGLASGIWSCLPDGSDVEWHSLGCGDNPVEVDFTGDGQVIGVQNLYYSQPRGDTIVHWLYGGVYERQDQMKAIAGLPRTLPTMPVMYNFGHVAVSGCTFWRDAGAAREFGDGALQFLVTHFNTQRLVRMELWPEGATYRAVENEFVKLNDPNIHLTDVIEDRDGSLLLLDTGGWFRIGCPASLMAKPEITGGVYRIRRTKSAKPPGPVVGASVATVPPQGNLSLRRVGGADARRRLTSLASIARQVGTGAQEREALIEMAREPLDQVTEHALLYALMRTGGTRVEEVKKANEPRTARRLLMACRGDGEQAAEVAQLAFRYMGADDAELARTAVAKVLEGRDADAIFAPKLLDWLGAVEWRPGRLATLRTWCAGLISQPETQKLIGAMLRDEQAVVRHAALEVLAEQTAGVVSEEWLPALERMLSERSMPMPLLLDAVRKAKNPRFDARLQALADDAGEPLALRLKALGSMRNLKLGEEAFALLLETLTGAASSAAARIQAAAMLGAAPLQPGQVARLAPAFAVVGPVEMKELCGQIKKLKDAAVARPLAEALAGNPAIGGQQESLYRTAFSNLPPEVFEGIVLPAYRGAGEAAEAKKRQLGALAEKASTSGRAEAGRQGFESGKGTCIACHRIGDKGRPVGPSLDKIGAIRSERDLLESILFPSQTLARDYEAHVFETEDGQTVMGVIKSHTAEGLLVADVAGQEKNIPHAQIVSDTALPTSLMPMGLDQTMPEQDLLDLVAYLRSLR